MKKRWLKYVLCTVFLAITQLNIAQIETDTVSKLTLQTKAKFTLNTSAHLIKTDNMGQVYIIDDDEILKLNANGDTLFVSSNKINGTVNSIDVNFALKPLLFHKDQNAITFLDNTLTVQGNSVDLNNYNIFQPTAVCNSYSSNVIWVYNLDNYELLKVDREQGVVFQSGNLQQQLDIDQNITQLVEHKNQLYANCPETGVLVFDIYGTYLKTYPIKNASHIQIFENSVVAQTENGLIRYSPKSFALEDISLSITYDWIEINAGQMYVKDGNRLVVLEVE